MIDSQSQPGIVALLMMAGCLRVGVTLGYAEDVVGGRCTTSHLIRAHELDPVFKITSCLAHLVERTTFNCAVMGSIPTMGVHFLSASQGAHVEECLWLLIEWS